MAQVTKAQLVAQLEAALVRVQQLERELHEARTARPVVQRSEAQRTFWKNGKLCTKVLVDASRSIYAIREVAQ